MLILLAEDSKTLALALRKKLEAMGHEVVLAEDGQSAVDWFASGHPDLVVMDIEMPRMDGFQAARKIRDIEALSGDGFAWTPIVFLTATDTVQNLLHSIAAGGDDFLPKTSPDEVLGAKIKAMARIADLMGKVKSLAVENRRLEGKAATDPMTKLPNRRALDEALERFETRIALGESFGLAALMVDVDHFKRFNDSLGHAAGDLCLERVGKVLAEAAREWGPGAFAARYGGEEFIVLLEGSGREDAMGKAWDLCARVEQMGIVHPQSGAGPMVSCSIGVSCLGSTGIKAMLKRADEALYASKQEGRARASFA